MFTKFVPRLWSPFILNKAWKTIEVVKVGGHDGELRLWHYIYVYSIKSRLTMRFTS